MAEQIPFKDHSIIKILDESMRPGYGFANEAVFAAANPLGAYVGKGALAVADLEARENASDQGHFEPVYENVPQPIEAEGVELKYVANKLGETRGIYFTRILATVKPDAGDTDPERLLRYEDLLEKFTLQLFVQQNIDTSNRAKTITPYLKKDADIAFERSLLERIAQGDLSQTGLNDEKELDVLRELVQRFGQYQDKLRIEAVAANTTAVEAMYASRRLALRSKRYALRAASAVSILAGVGSGYFVPKLLAQPSATAKKAEREVVSQLQAAITLHESFPNDTVITDKLNVFLQTIAEEHNARRAEDVSKKNQSLYERAEQHISDTAVVLNMPEDPTSLKKRLEREELMLDSRESPLLYVGGIGLVSITALVMGGAILYTAAKNGGGMDPYKNQIEMVKNGMTPQGYLFGIPNALAQYNAVNQFKFLAKK